VGNNKVRREKVKTCWPSESLIKGRVEKILKNPGRGGKSFRLRGRGGDETHASHTSLGLVGGKGRRRTKGVLGKKKEWLKKRGEQRVGFGRVIRYLWQNKDKRKKKERGGGMAKKKKTCSTKRKKGKMVAKEEKKLIPGREIRRGRAGVKLGNTKRSRNKSLQIVCKSMSNRWDREHTRGGGAESKRRTGEQGKETETCNSRKTQA